MPLFSQNHIPIDGNALLADLPAGSDSARTKWLLSHAADYLHREGARSANLDTGWIYLSAAAERVRSSGTAEADQQSVLLTGIYYLKKGDLTRGKHCFQEAVRYFTKEGNLALAAQAWNELGSNIPFSPKENIPEKIAGYRQARGLFLQANMMLPAIACAQSIAEAHLQEDMADSALAEMLSVLDQYRSIGYKNLQYAYDLLAEIYRAKVDIHKEFEYRMDVIKSMEASGDTTNADAYYSKLALIYSDLGMNDQSIVWINRAMRILEKQHRLEDYYGDLSLLVYDLITVGRAADALVVLDRAKRLFPPTLLSQEVDLNEEFGHCYSALKEYSKAEPYYVEMMRLYQITNFNKEFYTTNVQMVTDFIYYYQTMGTFYVLTKDYKKADFYLNKILALPSGAIRPVSMSKIEELKFHVDSALGNYVQAIRHLERHKDINDSLFNATKSKQINELQIRYETSKKEQDLKVLRTKEQLQTKELQQSAQVRRFIYGLLVVLLLLIAVVYSRYRLKQKSNRQLQVQQHEINAQNGLLRELLLVQQKLLAEKEWLVKEIHHRIKNNLQIVISLLNAQAEFLDSPAAIDAIRKTRERMEAIAIIHQRLYQSEHGTMVNMNAYIGELITNLGNSFTELDRISFVLDTDDIVLDVSQSVPLGLILNEAITNAVKYAFPDRQRGKIFIVLKKHGVDEVILKIRDNGVGFPAGMDLTRESTLGIQLMKLFAEQLEGNLAFDSHEGVEISLLFRPQLVPDTVAKTLFMQG